MINKSRIMIEDLRRFKFISDPQISPNGEKIAFVHTSINYDENRYMKHIWIWDRDSEKAEQYTYSSGRDSHPRWSPDGKRLLFLSRGRQQEKKKAQLYVIPTSGGEARLVADIEGGVMKPMWAPDSKQMLFLSRVWTEREPESDVRVVKRLKYKHDDVGIFAGTRPHIHIVEMGSSPKQLTKGEFDVDAAKWSPDGKRIALITNTAALLGQPYVDVSTKTRWPEPVYDPDLSFIRDIYIIPAKGGELEKLTPRKHVVKSLSWAPSGEEIAFVGHDFRRLDLTNTDIWVLPAEGGEPLNLTSVFDRDIGIGEYGPPLSDLRVAAPSPGAVWAPYASSIYFMAMDIPTMNIYRVDRQSREVEQLTEGNSVCSFSLSADGAEMAYSAMDSTHPAELWLRDGKSERRVTNFNDSLLEGLKLSVPEHFTFTNVLGMEVDGWVMRPVDYEERKRYPVVLQMHTTRLLCYGEELYHEFQVLAANGFAVIYTNAVGSGGYGEDYKYAAFGNVGILEFKDTMAFIDTTLERFQFIDPDRLGVTGWSFGGYMTNWIISQTNRFKAAVTCQSFCNSVTKHATGDSSYMWPDRDTGTTDYISEMEKFHASSPLKYVKNVETPTLIIHSENDLRCPIEQAEQWFMALKIHARVPTELVRFPNENHSLNLSGEPKHREERLKHILRWFNKYMKRAQVVQTG